MDIISMMITCILWFIAGIIVTLLFVIGCVSGFTLNDEELFATIKDDDKMVSIVKFMSAFPGYSLGKELALWIKEQENDL